MKQTCTKILLLTGVLCGISLQASTTMKAELESLANRSEKMGAVVTAAKIAATQLGVIWPAETNYQFDNSMLVAKGVVQFPGYVAEAALLKDRSLMIALLEGFNSGHKLISERPSMRCFGSFPDFSMLIEQSAVAAENVLEAAIFNYVNSWAKSHYAEDEHAKVRFLRVATLLATAFLGEMLIGSASQELQSAGVIDRVGRTGADVQVEKLLPVVLRCLAEYLGQAVATTMASTEEVIQPTSEGISA